MRILTSTSLLAMLAVMLPGALRAQEAANIEAAKLLGGFSLLGATEAGRTVLEQNLETSIGINNNATAAQQAQAVNDNTIAALVGSFSNGILVSDALGSRLGAAFAATNAARPDYSATTFSANFQALMSQVNALAQSDSAFTKNFYANGSVHGDPAEQATGISLPPGGAFNVYDTAYDPLPANANTVGNSRPVQVAPERIESIDAPDYFGTPVNTGTDVLPTLISNASFPSGHSAFGFTTTLLFAQMVPERYQEFLARGAEYGNSRIVLGAHYAFDVIGARITATKAVADMLNNSDLYTGRSFNDIFGRPVTSTDDFAGLLGSATTDLRAMLETGCGDSIAACVAASDPDRFSDAGQRAADYADRLTYGLGPVGDTTLAPVVPEGAEVLLASRFAYLGAEQRRAVLASTELPSGQPLDDGSGWARLDLAVAAKGYGAFEEDVDVTMNAAEGGFSAADRWSNDISGNGGLTKRGDGKLELAGANSYTGKTLVEGGEVAVTGTVAGEVKVAGGGALSGQGTILGDVTVNGLLAPGAEVGMLTIGGDLDLSPSSTLSIGIAGDAPSLFSNLAVGGDLWLDDATLDVDLTQGYALDAFSRFTIIDLAGRLSGLFAGLEEGDILGMFGRQQLFITYAGGDGNDIDLYTVAPVPVPVPLALMLGGLGTLVAVTRRKRG